jgi:hypothetical protein
MTTKPTKTRDTRRRSSRQKRRQSPPAAGPYKGSDEVARGIASLIDSFSSDRIAPASVFEISPELPDSDAMPCWLQSDSDAVAHLADGQDHWTLHCELFGSIAKLEKIMFAERANLRLGLRHSNAPEPVARIPFDSKDRRAIDSTIAFLKTQPPKPAIQPEEALEAAAKLQMIAERICTHFAVHVEAPVTDAMDTGEFEYAKTHMIFQSWGILACNLIAVARATRRWIGSGAGGHWT